MRTPRARRGFFFAETELLRRASASRLGSEVQGLVVLDLGPET